MISKYCFNTVISKSVNMIFHSVTELHQCIPIKLREDLEEDVREAREDWVGDVREAREDLEGDVREALSE